MAHRAACCLGICLASGLVFAAHGSEVSTAEAPPGAGASAPVTAAAAFAPFEPGPADAAWVLSTEAEVARRSWQDLEQATAGLARITVGSLPGEPAGWLIRRPVRLHYRTYELAQERVGGVVIVPGFTEGLTMYQEVIHDFVRNGFSVYIHDHRGQGFSTRLLDGADEGDKGHLDQFSHLVDDLEHFVQRVVQQRGPQARPLFLLAHSMGGAVSALYLQRVGADAPLAAAALVTPMFEPAVAQARADGQVGALRRWCEEEALQLPFSLPWLSSVRVQEEGFDAERKAFLAQADPSDNDLSHGVPRLLRRWEDRLASCTSADCGHGDARVAGPTLRWVDQACAASRQARGPEAGRIRRPVLLLQGALDTVVVPEAQQQFCANVNQLGRPPGRCVGRSIERARHSVLVESDSLRNPALAAVMSFFAGSGR